MPEPKPNEPFFLIVIDHDARRFCVEGPMTNDNSWNLAAGRARENGFAIQCGPSGADRAALAIDYQKTSKLGSVPPGSILRPRG